MALEPQDDGDLRSRYEALIDGYSKGQESDLLRANEKASSLPKAQGAKILDLSGRTGLAPDFIERNLDWASKEAARPSYSKLQDFMKSSPNTAELYRDPHQASAMGDDVWKLGALEKMIRDKQAGKPLPKADEEIWKEAKAFSAMVGPERYEASRLAHEETGQTPPPMEAFIDQLAREDFAVRKAEEDFIRASGKMGFMDVLDQRSRENRASFIPFLAGLSDIGGSVEIYQAKKAISEGRGTPIDLDRVLRHERLQAAKGARGTSFGGKVAGVLEGLPAFMGEMMLTGGPASFVVKKAIPKLATGAAESFLKRGAIKAAEGTVQSALLAPTHAPQIALERMTAQGVLGVDQAGNYVWQATGEQGEPAWIAIPKAGLSTWADVTMARMFEPWWTKGPSVSHEVVRQSILKAGVVETAKVIGMTEMSKIVKELGGVVSWEAPGPIKALYDVEAREELGAQALVFGSMGAFHQALGNRASRRAEESRAILHAFNALSTELGQAKEAPAVAEGTLKALANGTGHEAVFISPDEWTAYYQSKGMNPREEAVRVLGSAEGYDRSVAAGHQIRVPIEKYSVRMDEEARKHFETRGPFGPEEMTVEEVKEALEKAKKAEGLAPLPEGDFGQDILKKLGEAKAAGEPKEAVDRLEAAWQARKSEAEQAAHPLFQDVRKFMSEKDADEYLKAVVEGREASERYLTEKALKAEEAKKKAAYQERRLAVENEVQLEVDSRPEMKALSFLERGTLPDGSPLGEGYPEPFKLDRQAILERYGKEALKFLPPRIMASELGVHPEQAAEMLGFTSGDELLQALGKVKMGSVSEKELESRRTIEALEKEAEIIRQALPAIEKETKEASKEVMAGREAIGRRLEAALKAQERQMVSEIQSILDEIRAAGGIRPVQETGLLPKKWQARRGEGVRSDELAMDLFERGIDTGGVSEGLYHWLAKAEEILARKQERVGEIEKEAKRLGREKVASGLEVLIRNAEERAGIMEALAGQKQELAKARRGIQADRRDAIIQGDVERRMAAEFPDFMKSPELPLEAVKAIHNDRTAARLRFELKWMAKNRLHEMKAGLRAVAKIPELEDLKKYAKETVDGMSDLEIDLGLFRNAERRGAIDAREAALKGDWERAWGAKMQELLNHDLYRAAAAARERSAVMVEYLGTFDTLSVRQRMGKAEGGHLEAIESLRDRFEFTSRGRRVLERRASFREWYDAQEKLADEGLGVLPDVPDYLIDESYRRNWRELPFSELRGLYETVKGIEHQADLKNELVSLENRRALDEAARDVAGNVQATRKALLKPVDTRAPGTRQLFRWASSFWAHVRTISGYALEMDGFKEDGLVQERILRPIQRAQTREAVMREKALRDLREMIDNTWTKRERLGLNTLEYVPEINDSMTRWNRVMTAMNMGNRDNLTKLKEGRGWTDEQIAAIVDPLSKKELDFAQGWRDYLEREYWPLIRDLHKRVTGLAPEKVDPEAFMTKYGEYRGGYHPLKYDPDLSPRADERIAEGEVEQAFRGATFRASTRQGHRKARVKGVNQAVRLDPGVMYEHLHDVIHDVTHYEAVLDVNRLLATNEVKNAINDHYGPEVLREFRSWIMDVATGDKPAADSFERTMNWLRRGTSPAVLGWNLLQAATDWIGVTQGMVRVGPLWVAKGLSRWAGDAVRMENTAGWIYERSEFMRLRGKTQMRELYEIRNSLAGQGRLADLADFGLDAVTAGRIDLQDVKDSYWWFMSRVQKLQDIPTWLGAYEKAMAQMKAENGRPASEFERSAIEAADQAVRESFSHGQIGSLPGILRGGPVKKLWTTFYSFANATLNNAVLSVRRFRQAPYSFSSTGRLASDMALLYIAPAALATAVYTLLSSEHKNEDELKEALVKQEVGYLMGSVPLLRELSGSIQGRDYQGPAGARFFAQAGRAVKAAAKGEADWKDLNSAAGVFFHYPANQVNRIIQAIASEGGNPLSRLFGQR